MTDAESARGAAAALDLLWVIVAPGDLLDDPVRVVDRCWRAAVSVASDGAPLELEPIAIRLSREIAGAPTPVLGAVRAATVFRLVTGSITPSAERLIFMAAEHSLRGAGRAGSDVEADRPEAFLRRMDASWICPPSIALTQGRFRTWSPGSDSGYFDLLDGLVLEMDRALGALPLLRRWRETSRSAAAGRHGKSRLRDLVELAARDPILNAPHVRNTLGISERASLYLVREAQEAGILTLITPRSSYRVWAQPQMASLLGMRAARRPAGTWNSPAVESGPGERLESRMPGPNEMREREERTAVALAELDEAMNRADAILAKYRKAQIPESR